MRIEGLEFRRLLAAVLNDDGTLVVTGTADSEVITIGYNSAGDKILVGFVSAEEFSFDPAKVAKISVDAGDGNDTVLLSAGSRFATVNGGTGNDSIVTSRGTDSLVGGEGDDTLDGGSGSDNLIGGPGDDQLLGRAGVDVLNGGLGADSIDGGGGDSNRADYSDRIDDLTITLDGIANDGAVGENDNVVRCDYVNGGRGDDSIVGNSHVNELNGFAGADTLVGQGGADHLDALTPLFAVTDDELGNLIDGGSGGDMLIGGNGPDTILGQGGADRIDADDGDDSVRGGSGDDDISDGTGDDMIFAEAGNDRGLPAFHDISANVGNDTIDAGSGDDQWSLDSGDEISGSTSTKQFFGRDGNDLVMLSINPLGSADPSTFSGGSGTDRISIAWGDDTVLSVSLDGVPNDGTPGDTHNVLGDFEDVRAFGIGDARLDASAVSKRVSLMGTSGNDTLIGGASADLLFGGNGDDTLDGGPAEDRVRGGEGNDDITGGSGGDAFNGGDGDDTLHAADGEADLVNGGDVSGDHDSAEIDVGLDSQANLEVIL